MHFGGTHQGKLQFFFPLLKYNNLLNIVLKMRRQSNLWNELQTSFSVSTKEMNLGQIEKPNKEPRVIERAPVANL